MEITVEVQVDLVGGSQLRFSATCRATTGAIRILEFEPKKLHQRVPLIIGSKGDVDTVEAFIQGRA